MIEFIITMFILAAVNITLTVLLGACIEAANTNHFHVAVRAFAWLWAALFALAIVVVSCLMVLLFFGALF